MAQSIAVVAANGKAGQLIVKEALERGHDVTVFVRSENRTPAKKTVIKDIMELTAQDLEGFDAVVDAFGAWTPETLPPAFNDSGSPERYPLWHRHSSVSRGWRRQPLPEPRAHADRRSDP